MNLHFVCLYVWFMCECLNEGGRGEREKWVSEWEGLEGSVVSVQLLRFYSCVERLEDGVCSWELSPFYYCLQRRTVWVWHMCFQALLPLGVYLALCLQVSRPTCCSCIKQTGFPHGARWQRCCCCCWWRGRGGRNRCDFALVRPWTEPKSSLWFEPDRFPTNLRV